MKTTGANPTTDATKLMGVLLILFVQRGNSSRALYDYLVKKLELRGWTMERLLLRWFPSSVVYNRKVKILLDFILRHLFHDLLMSAVGSAIPLGRVQVQEPEPDLTGFVDAVIAYFEGIPNVPAVVSMFNINLRGVANGMKELLTYNRGNTFSDNIPAWSIFRRFRLRDSFRADIEAPAGVLKSQVIAAVTTPMPVHPLLLRDQTQLHEILDVVATIMSKSDQRLIGHRNLIEDQN